MYRDPRDAQIDQRRAENAALRAAPLTGLDWIAAGLAVTGVLALLAFPLATRSFDGMFREFGGALPWVTRVALFPGTPVAFALASGALLARAVRSDRGIAARRRLVLAAFALSLVALGAPSWAMYLPIVRLAGNVRAE